MRFVILILAGLLLAAPQEGIPDAKLKALKAATLLVRRVANSGSHSGPGFVVHRAGESCLVVTSRRSVEAVPSFFVIQHPGTPEERKFPAEYVGEDPGLDLLLLKVNLPDAPTPLAPVASEPRETLPVFILGFPLGDSMTPGAENPRVAVGKGTVGSLRRNPKGELVRIQLDADAGPGNFGAPVVDREGGLVGWAGGRLGETRISAAVPAQVLQEVLKGRAFLPELKVLESKDGMVRVQAGSPLLDPSSSIKSVSLLTVRKDQVAGDPPADILDSWTPVSADMKETPLTIRGSKAVGELILQGDPGGEVLFVFQVKLVRADGKVRYSAPWDFNAKPAVAPAAAAAAGRPARRPADEDWLGSDEERKRWSGGSIEVLLTEKTLEVKKTLVDGLEVISIPPEVFGERGAGERVALSKNGRALYYIARGQALVKVRVPEFVEERRVPIGRNIDAMGWTKEGIAIRTQGGTPMKTLPGEVWIFNPETLARVRQLPMTDTFPICFLPDQSQAILYHADRVRFLDLKTGSTFKETLVSKAASSTKWFDKAGVVTLSGELTASADGSYATVAGNTTITAPIRIDVENGSFRIEEVGAPIGQLRFFFGHPGPKHAVIRTGNLTKVKGHPEFKGQGTVVYRITDFSKALCVVPEVDPLCGGPKSGQFWGLQKSGELGLYDETGKKVRSWFPFEPGMLMSAVVAAADESAFIAKEFSSSRWTWIRWTKS
jgi:hypothetical protein